MGLGAVVAVGIVVFVTVGTLVVVVSKVDTFGDSRLVSPGSRSAPELVTTPTVVTVLLTLGGSASTGSAEHAAIKATQDSAKTFLNNVELSIVMGSF